MAFASRSTGSTASKSWPPPLSHPLSKPRPSHRVSTCSLLVRRGRWFPTNVWCRDCAAASFPPMTQEDMSKSAMLTAFNAIGCSTFTNGTSCFMMAGNTLMASGSTIQASLPACAAWLQTIAMGNMTETSCNAQCSTLFTMFEDTVGCCGYGLFKAVVQAMPGPDAANLVKRMRFVYKKATESCGGGKPTTCASSSTKFKTSLSLGGVNCTAVLADWQIQADLMQQAIDTIAASTGTNPANWDATFPSSCGGGSSRRLLQQNGVDIEMTYTGESDEDVSSVQTTYQSQQAAGVASFETLAAAVPPSAITGDVTVGTPTPAPTPAPSVGGASAVAASSLLVAAALAIAL
eukprot:JP446122.1.p1 GENE.JP446122.1~~JP446122.1.p1  ORF type:complete len:348 (+),score=99.80 JP446122.1:412-1455(+)